jgi:hypothetical protein
VKGATSKEQSIVNEAFYLADRLTDERHVAPIREAVELSILF